MLEDQKAKRREIHRRSMIITGMMTTAAGVAAAYLALGPGGPLPSWMYGRWTGKSEETEAPARPAPMLVRFQPWTPSALAQAAAGDRLVLLSLVLSGSRPCAMMDRGAFADIQVASMISQRFTAIRTDADERPDLALRYGGRGWPSTSLLMPNGEPLSEGHFMGPRMFLEWAGLVEASFRKKGAGGAALSGRGWRRLEALAKGDVPLSRGGIEDQARERMKSWNRGSGGRWSRFRDIRLIFAHGPDWARKLAISQAESALKLEDPAWGGFFRYAKGPGWKNLEYEKKLGDQADAAAALCWVDQEACRRVLNYVEGFLKAPEGGYYAGQGSELELAHAVMPGSEYFGLPSERRKALGRPFVDRRIFTGPSARMAAVVLASSAATNSMRAHALKTLDRLWERASDQGRASRHLGAGPWGLLEDQLGLAEAGLAAHGATRSPAYLARASSSFRFMESELLGAEGAYYDRLPTGELLAVVDRLAVPALNLDALLIIDGLERALASDHPLRPSLARRRRQLALWLSRHGKTLSAGELLALLNFI